MRAFANRAIRKANGVFSNNLAESLAPSQATSLGESVADLVRGVREEDNKIHVDVPGRVCNINLDGIHSDLLPAQDPTSKMATKREKVSRFTHVRK